MEAVWPRSSQPGDLYMFSLLFGGQAKLNMPLKLVLRLHCKRLTGKDIHGPAY